MNSSPPAVPASESPGLKLLRFVIATGLALILLLLSVLFLIGYSPAAEAAIQGLLSPDSELPEYVVIPLGIIVLLLPPVGLIAAARRGRLTWTALAVGGGAVLAVLAWLAWDEPAIRHPLTLEEFSPTFQGAEQSFAVLMQYSKQTPSAEAKAFGKTRWMVFGAEGTTKEPAKWLEFVVRNRAALEQEWTDLAPQRRWLAELAAFDRIGDLTPPDPGANIMAFQPVRVLSQRTCAIATLQALDGHGDEAIATLVPLLEVSRKLQLSSRTLVRTMLAVVMERMTMETAAMVLDRTPVSAASRAQLSAALAGENAPALARRLILVEYVHFAPLVSRWKFGDFSDFTMTSKRPAFMRQSLNLVSGVVLNPVATANLYGEGSWAFADLAERRELGQLATRGKAFTESLLSRPSMKNLGGRFLITMAMPALNKVVEQHWQTADLRAALRQRLADPR